MPGRHRPRRGTRHREFHRSEATSWLRATVLGANDGILSTGALLLGVASANGDRTSIITAGIAGLVAGAGSMAIGEYVSVSAQGDAEAADRRDEAHELRTDPGGELLELQGIYEERGLPPALALEVAETFMDHDPLGAHLRDELGHTEASRARPVEAAVFSFVSFSVGALIPILTAILAGDSVRRFAVVAATLLCLLGLGGVGAKLGQASIFRGAMRVGIGGAIALGLSFLIGELVGVALG